MRGREVAVCVNRCIPLNTCSLPVVAKALIDESDAEGMEEADGLILPFL